MQDDVLKKIRDVAVRAFIALGLKAYARIDMFVPGDGRVVVLEPNSLPGMTPTSLVPQEAAAAGISYEDLCERIIALSMEKYEAE